MKCIKAIKSTGTYKEGHMLRVADKDAERRVSTGYWNYTSKSEFKGSTGEKEVVMEEPKKKKSKEVEKKSYGRKKTK
jgi:hypothetical protein